MALRQRFPHKASDWGPPKCRDKAEGGATGASGEMIAH